jgi:hypothetical protein
MSQDGYVREVIARSTEELQSQMSAMSLSALEAVEDRGVPGAPRTTRAGHSLVRDLPPASGAGGRSEQEASQGIE